MIDFLPLRALLRALSTVLASVRDGYRERQRRLRENHAENHGERPLNGIMPGGPYLPSHQRVAIRIFLASDRVPDIGDGVHECSLCLERYLRMVLREMFCARPRPDKSLSMWTSSLFVLQPRFHQFPRQPLPARPHGYDRARSILAAFGNTASTAFGLIVSVGQ